MKIGVIADDFTGASDMALTLAEAGATTVQLIGLPVGDADPDLDACVVALKSRTAPVDDAVSQSCAAADWLLEQGAEQIVFKVCSTFDSTPEGNIGPVLDALSDRLNVAGALVCPAFPENGRSVYMGHLFVADQLLSESGMQDHPLTPMTDPDLRRVLAVQSTRPVRHIGVSAVAAGAEAIANDLPGEGHIILDAIRDADLLEIGRAAKGAPLLCGGSGIGLGLPANFDLAPATPAWTPVEGPGVVLSGSCSRATREQVTRFQSSAAAFEVSAEAIMGGNVSVADVAAWVLAQEAPPLVYSSADPDVVRAVQSKIGREASASLIETFFSDLAAELAHRGVTRIVVAGGETSGAAVSGLEARALVIGPRIAAGVPMVRVAERPLALALKSGNFGGPDFFNEALAAMEGQ